MYEDTPQELVHDLISQAVFGSHALGRPVIGTADVISSVSKRTLQSYHRSLYTPPNIVVAAAGAVDHDQLVELVERAVERRAAVQGGKPRVRPLLAKAPKPGLRFQRKDTEQYHVCLGAPGVSRSDRRRFAASILDAILGGSASSDSSRRSARSAAWPMRCTASSRSTRTPGRSASTSGRARTTWRARSRSRSSRSATCRRQHPGAGARRAKENLKGRVVLSMESTSTRMNRLGKSLVTDSEILSLDRIVAEIEAVEAELVSELASELLAPERMSAAGIGPSEERFLEALEQVSPTLARAA